MRNNVDFPQPEGPTSTVNEPSGTDSVKSGIVSIAPKVLLILLNSTFAMS